MLPLRMLPPRPVVLIRPYSGIRRAVADGHGGAAISRQLQATKFGVR
jgi:hypothetical protein